MSFPISPTNGQIATVNGIRYSYASATQSWTRISNAKYTAAATAPSNPANGDQWYNTSLDILFEYLNDGTSNYWVDITSLGQAGNISIVTDSTLAGNIVLGLNNVYSIGAATGYLKNVYANAIVANTITTTTGLFWANGTAFSSGLSAGASWAQRIFWGY